MTKRFYIQLLALIILLCYPSHISADDYSLAPSTGRKVYVPIDAESAKGQLLVTNTAGLRFKISLISFLFRAQFYMKRNML